MFVPLLYLHARTASKIWFQCDERALHTFAHIKNIAQLIYYINNIAQQSIKDTKETKQKVHILFCATKNS